MPVEVYNSNMKLQLRTIWAKIVRISTQNGVLGTLLGGGAFVAGRWGVNLEPLLFIEK